MGRPINREAVHEASHSSCFFMRHMLFYVSERQDFVQRRGHGGVFVSRCRHCLNRRLSRTRTWMEAIVTKQVQDKMAQSSQSLLGDLDRLITDKLSGQVTEMRRLRDAVDTKPHKFRKRGNEEQFNINSKVLEKITDAETALGCLLDKENLQIDEREVTELHSVHAAVVESKDLLKKRQKLVKLADKSESGWKVVDQYESNELAEDSEDEKKINKAENRASRKIKENRRFGTRGFFGRRQGRWHPYQPQGYTPSYGRFNHTRRLVGWQGRRHRQAASHSPAGEAHTDQGYALLVDGQGTGGPSADW